MCNHFLVVDVNDYLGVRQRRIDDGIIAGDQKVLGDRTLEKSIAVDAVNQNHIHIAVDETGDNIVVACVRLDFQSRVGKVPRESLVLERILSDADD